MKYFFSPLFVLLALVFSVGCQTSGHRQALPGVVIYSETRTNPPTRFFVAEVDLKNPRLHVHVSRGGPDPDGPGKWQTTLLQPTQIAEREKYDFVINGDFFIAQGVNDGEGTNSGFRAGQWARVEGPAMSAGEMWATSSNARPCLVIHQNRSATIETWKQPGADAREVIAGNVILVKDGVIVPSKNKQKHPRTVAGLDATGTKLTLLLVDGRKPGIAVGMTYEELAAEMIRLGCRQALNLDGGGSSIMAVYEPHGTNTFHILNAPTDFRERAVGNVLGITIDKK